MSTLEQRIADVIEAIAFEFKRSKETVNSGIDEKTLNRIMRCVHAWEKTVDTDKDGVTDYDEYEVHNSDPDKMDTNKVEVPNDTNDTVVYDIRVLDCFFSGSKVNVMFQLTENGSSVRLQNEPYTIKAEGKELPADLRGGLLYYSGTSYNIFEVSIEFKGVTTTRKFIYNDNSYVKAT